MKRNLSSQAIKAMAIGMAVALGSSTAISGVVGGTVVEAYAQAFENCGFNGNVAKNSTTGLKITLTPEDSGTNSFQGSGDLTGLLIYNGEEKVFEFSSSNATATVNGGNLEITITNGNLLPDSLDGTETSLTIKKLTSTDIKFGTTAGSAGVALDFDATSTGESLTITSSGALGIDKTSPTISNPVYSTDGGNKITLTTSKEVTGTLSDDGGFTIEPFEGGSSGVTVSNGTVDGTNITLNLSGPITTTQTKDYVVKYNGTGITSSDTSTPLKQVNDTSLKFEVKGSATVEMKKAVYSEEEGKGVITLTAESGQTLTGTTIDKSNAAQAGFDIKKDNTSIISENAIDSIVVNSGSGRSAIDTIKITLTSPLEKGNYTVDYTEPGEAKITGLKNFKGLNVEGFAPEKPEIVNELTATVNGVGTYTFKRVNTSGESTDVMLTGFTKSTNQKAAAPAGNATTGELKNGIVTANGVEYKLTQIGDGTTALTEITTEALNNHTNAVTKINASAFEGNTNITNTDVFGNVTTVEANAFKGATKLKNVNLRSATSVGASAFEGASNLTTVSLPKVTSVAGRAFAHTSVKTADLGSEVPKGQQTTVNSNAFAGVKTLEKVETNPQSKDSVKEAVKQSDSDNVTVDNGNGTDTVNPGNNNSSGGGGVGSSGGGASIGTSAQNNNNNNNNSNNGGTTTPVVEDKELTFDVISLPSVTGEAKVFGDVSANHWAKAHIDKLSTAGIINGVDGNFNPNGQTKRADVTIMLVNLLGLTPETNTKFADVNPSAYYAPYVGTASTYGIVNGSNGMFNPEGVISRQDTMVMIAQILKGLNLNVNTDTSALSQFTDVNSVAGYANESVAILVNSGIITGNNGKLNPTAPVTRAEMATIMSKLYDVLDATSK